jgi:hypothetical protein
MLKSPHPAADLSFMRVKTGDEGGGVDYFNVISADDYRNAGNYAADFERGKASAREYLDYLGKHPTNGNATLLGCIAVDMIRKGTPKGLVLGFMAEVNDYAMGVAKVLVAVAEPVPVDNSGDIGEN